MSLGKKIRYLRREKDLTQKELGKMLGVAESTISLYESGRNVPDISMCRKIAIIFNISLDELVGIEIKENIHPYFGLTEEEIVKMESYKNYVISERNKIEHSATKERNKSVAMGE